VRAAAPVHERQVDEHRQTVAGDPGDESLLHLIEVQGLIAGAAGCADHSVSWSRRNIQFWLEPRADDVRGPRQL